MVTSRLLVASMVGMVAVRVAMASSSCDIPDASAVNPGNLQLTETRLGVQNVVSLLQKSQVAHAADENCWYRSPSVFSEYTFTCSDDRRAGGFDSDMNSGTVGLNFLTACDVAMSLMATYGWGTAETDGVGPVNLSRNLGLTASAAKNIDWFLFGTSLSYNDSDSRTRTPIGGTPKSFTDGVTIAPFIGAMYASGNFSFSTVPTYMFNLNWVDFDSTISSATDHVRQDTFVLMNTANYNLTEQLTLSLVGNWNRVTHVKRNLAAAPAVADREWVTVGPKVTYHLSPETSLYASCSRDVFTSTYDTMQAVVGMNCSF